MIKKKTPDTDTPDNDMRNVDEPDTDTSDIIYRDHVKSHQQ